MKRMLYAIALFMAASILSAQTAGGNGKILLVYDEINKESEPYLGYFRTGFKEAGIPFDEAAAADLDSKDLSKYRTIVVYGMVMAFNFKSPVRDWLKTEPDLRGMKVSIFVTANRWFLKNLYGQLTDLAGKNEAEVTDAVSMATKELEGGQEEAAVRALIAKLEF
ncbi:MAG: hypothetical protein A2Z99_16215 [Treponema sp. GWB1_62_6]|nr:MAG: hypothetical protein A2Y36_01115 [Treponema sp. GWA1_62_8]OHE64180.1 MAG: hypothetical protein A2Z99_16215 [Treponema sp. GWB1_62_6]OHE65796.1 MAG: hypothetical protein A2001_11670 [Treponema sp. GWC1_61_84]HCM28651.1 hypothetical protein [Treponema sp.]